MKSRSVKMKLRLFSSRSSGKSRPRPAACFADASCTGLGAYFGLGFKRMLAVIQNYQHIIPRANPRNRLLWNFLDEISFSLPVHVHAAEKTHVATRSRAEAELTQFN